MIPERGELILVKRLSPHDCKVELKNYYATRYLKSKTIAENIENQLLVSFHNLKPN